jgi:hypothetical protein
MRGRDDWDRLVEDVEYVEYVEYVGPVETLYTHDLQCKLVQHVQVETDMGVMTTNGQNSTARGILVGGDQEETNDTVLIPQVRPAHKYPNSPWEMIHPPGGDNAVCM